MTQYCLEQGRNDTIKKQNINSWEQKKIRDWHVKQKGTKADSFYNIFFVLVGQGTNEQQIGKKLFSS